MGRILTFRLGGCYDVYRLPFVIVAVIFSVVLVIGVGSIAASDSVNNVSVSEPAYIETVPEPGDGYFEAEDPDGEWISYINPRDEYRSPYLGPGSGKICVSLYNEAGEVIVGESIPDTTVSIPTGETLEWHTSADPFTVSFPLTEQYHRPLDADQFGSNDSLPQGDGYLDSHCLEFHGLADDDPVEYGEAVIEGEDADRVEVVGYIEQPNEAWDSTVDPFGDARPYDEVDGGWTNMPDGSHGQAVVVLQLTGPPEDENETTHIDPHEGISEAIENSSSSPPLDRIDLNGHSNESSTVDDTDQTDQPTTNATDDTGERSNISEPVDDAEAIPGPGLTISAVVMLLIGWLIGKRPM